MLDRLAGFMQFTSVAYLVFLAAAVIIYYALPGARAKALWLLAGSAAFYLLLSPRWAWILALVTVLTYVLGLLIDRARSAVGPGSRSARALVASGVVLVVSALIAFKYLGFIAQAGNSALEALGLGTSLPVIQLALPIGISFWSFQTIAYLVDVYRGRTGPVLSFFSYAAAVTFFPVVTAGPITRVQSLVSQFQRRHRFDPQAVRSGLLLVGRGFFKKLMVADRLAVFVSSVFDDPRSHAGATEGLLFSVAAVFFAIQLYCDFSGYTDIVRGSARLFGVELPLNFRAPYFARDVRDFWRRWHMSLMDWLREYVYIPLGGNRKGAFRRDLNVMAVFLISGLWHGAGLTYLVWGLLNGAYMIIGEKTAAGRQRLLSRMGVDQSTLGHRALQITATFGLVTFAWVFFRANTMSEALYIVQRMFVPTVWIFFDGTMLQQGLSFSELMITLLSVAVVWALDWASLRTDVLSLFLQQPVVVRWTLYYSLILVVAVFGYYGGAYDAAHFVYFKF